MPTKELIAWLITGALVAAPAIASADATVEVGLGGTKVEEGTGFNVSPLLHFDLGITDSIGVAADWGFTFTRVSGGGESDAHFGVGNPFFSGFYGSKSDTSHWRVGAGITLPLARVAKDDVGDFLLSLVNYGFAATSRGTKNIWLWTPETISIAFPAEYERRFGPIFVAGDAALAIIVPTGEFDSGDTQVVTQLEARGGFDFEFIEVGAALTGVFLLTSDDDKAQLSLRPFASVDVGAVNIKAALVVNLDGPGGFSFDDGRIWGFQVGAGVDF